MTHLITSCVKTEKAISQITGCDKTEKEISLITSCVKTEKGGRLITGCVKPEKRDCVSTVVVNKGSFIVTCHKRSAGWAKVGRCHSLHQDSILARSGGHTTYMELRRVKSRWVDRCIM